MGCRRFGGNQDRVCSRPSLYLLPDLRSLVRSSGVRGSPIGDTATQKSDSTCCRKAITKNGFAAWMDSVALADRTVLMCWRSRLWIGSIAALLLTGGIRVAAKGADTLCPRR